MFYIHKIPTSRLNFKRVRVVTERSIFDYLPDLKMVLYMLSYPLFPPCGYLHDSTCVCDCGDRNAPQIGSYDDVRLS